jgi:hypothetical protein
LSNDCKYTGKVTVSLNGASLQKDPDATGAVSVTVTIKSLNSGTLDDPVDVSLHEGANTAVVSGPAQTASGTPVGAATVNASFVLQAPPTTTTATTAPVSSVTPVTTTTTSSGGGGLAGTGAEILAMLAVALFAIVLGSHTLASQAASFDVSWPALRDMSLPRFDAFLPEQETLQKRLLTAASYVLGPPPGRHAKRDGPRGLVPMARDWIYRKR